MSVVLQVRGPVDDEELTRLHARAFGGGEPPTATPWGERLRRHSVSWVTAYEGDRLVGFVHACWDGGVHAFLLDTVVEPADQGRGIGRRLVAALVVEVRAAGCGWLHVDHAAELTGFYAGCGFVPTAAGLLRLR